MELKFKMTEQEEIEYHENIIRLALEAECGNVVAVPKCETVDEFFEWLDDIEIKDT